MSLLLSEYSRCIEFLLYKCHIQTYKILNRYICYNYCPLHIKLINIIVIFVLRLVYRRVKKGIEAM